MIDILMATYNGEAFLEEQLNSIINQSYTKWRLLVRDDCSTDGTAAILQKYEVMYPEKISVIINKERTGSAKANFFKLLHDAKSKYIMFFDQDDIWKRNKIEITLRKMRQLEKKNGDNIPILVATDLEVVDAKGNQLDKSFLHYMNLPRNISLQHLLIQNNITGCTVMINRKLCDMLKKVKDVEKIVMHDHFAGLVAVAFGKAALLRETTIQYRQHEKNSVGAMNANSFGYMYQRFRRGKKQFQQDMKASMEQAEYLFMLYKDIFEEEPVREKQMIWQYSQLVDKSRIQKYRVYFKYHVFKHGLIRRVIQLIWC